MDGSEPDLNMANCRTRCHTTKKTLPILDGQVEAYAFIDAVTGTGVLPYFNIIFGSIKFQNQEQLNTCKTLSRKLL